MDATSGRLSDAADVIPGLGQGCSRCHSRPGLRISDARALVMVGLQEGKVSVMEVRVE